MSDDGIISLDAFRARQEKKSEIEEVTHENVTFRFSISSLERLDRFVDRLNAPHRGAVIAAAMDILGLCLTRIEDGKKIVAVDEEDERKSFLKDPRRK